MRYGFCVGGHDASRPFEAEIEAPFPANGIISPFDDQRRPEIRGASTRALFVPRPPGFDAHVPGQHVFAARGRDPTKLPQRRSHATARKVHRYGRRIQPFSEIGPSLEGRARKSPPWPQRAGVAERGWPAPLLGRGGSPSKITRLERSARQEVTRTIPERIRWRWNNRSCSSLRSPKGDTRSGLREGVCPLVGENGQVPSGSCWSSSIRSEIAMGYIEDNLVSGERIILRECGTSG